MNATLVAVQHEQIETLKQMATIEARAFGNLVLAPEGARQIQQLESTSESLDVQRASIEATASAEVVTSIATVDRADPTVA